MKFRATFTGIILFLFFNISNSSANTDTIIDSRHYSNAMGEIRNFRIFLPPGYAKNLQKRYPVIYFFHGWGQRYFGEGAEEYAGYDKGEQNKGDNIDNYVKKHDVIVVKADGYNRREDEEYYRRPYNVLPVETYRQFPIYFPELVSYIDARYRTIATRQQRAIAGLSMGGFMTFYLAAKYPHMVSSAGSFCGSPEFVIGPYDFPVEYKHQDMYRNLEGINVRLHYGDKDFIRSYHQDMNKHWSEVMDNYSWKIYDAAHSTCGLGEMFDSIMQTFKKPMATPNKWHHTEVYPDFTVWDYRISTDRTVPGFTVLENVDKRGFRCAVRDFVPDGQLLKNVKVMVVTAPVYEKNQVYTINDIDVTARKGSQTTATSDASGRLMIELNGGLHDIGINRKTDKPEIALNAAAVRDAGWATHGKEVKIGIELSNKGMSAAKNVNATLSAFRNNVKINSSKVAFDNIGINEVKEGKGLFSFISTKDSVDIIKFRVDITDDSKNKWSHDFDLPVKRAVKAFPAFEVADGRTVSVVSSGIESDTILLGKGNGDGVANPGETIVILAKDSGKLWRTDLTFSDKYFNPHGLVSRKSDLWSNMDHVGGSAKYDEVVIAAGHPAGEAEFFAEYWTPDYPMHVVHEGVVKVKIGGADKTPPVIEQVQYRGDNTIEAKIIDGGKIKSASARLNQPQEKEKDKETLLKLNDEGRDGDRAANDNIFSARLPDKKFSVYNVIIEAEDDSGNKVSKEEKRQFIAH